MTDQAVDVQPTLDEDYARDIEERSRAAGVEVTVVRGPNFQTDNPDLPEGYAEEIEERSRAAGVDVTVVRGPSTERLAVPSQTMDRQLPQGGVVMAGEAQVFDPDALAAAKDAPVAGRPAKKKTEAAPTEE